MPTPSKAPKPFDLEKFAEGLQAPGMESSIDVYRQDTALVLVDIAQSLRTLVAQGKGEFDDALADTQVEYLPVHEVIPEVREAVAEVRRNKDGKGVWGG